MRISWEKIGDCIKCGKKGTCEFIKRSFWKSQRLIYCDECILKRIKEEKVEDWIKK